MEGNRISINHGGKVITFEYSQQATILAVATAWFDGREMGAMSTGAYGALRLVFGLVSAALCRDGRKGLSAEEQATVIAELVG